MLDQQVLANRNLEEKTKEDQNIIDESAIKIQELEERNEKTKIEKD